MKRMIIAIGALLLSFGTAHSQELFTSGTWEEIQSKAQKENKLIFVDLYFEGCMPCAEMDKRVFPDPVVSKILAKHFVSFKTDVFKEEIGAKLSMKYAAAGFPTFAFLTADGQTIDVLSGFIGPTRFPDILEQMITRATDGQLKSYADTFEIGYPDFYSKAYTERKRQVSPDTINAFLSAQSDLSAELPYVVMTSFPLNDRYSNYYLAHAAELAAKYGRMPVRGRVASIIGAEAQRLGKNRDASAFEDILLEAKPLFADDEWGRFAGSFLDAYYQSSKDVAWMMGKLHTETATYTDWQDRSNVLAQLILDAKDSPRQLKQIDQLFQDNVDENSGSIDLYKKALLKLYLKDYAEAGRIAQLALRTPKQSYYLAEEQIHALWSAAQAKTSEGFEAVRAQDPKPMRMD